MIKLRQPRIITLEKIEDLQNVIEYPLKIIPHSTEILNVAKYRVTSSHAVSIDTFHGRRVV